PGTPVLRYGDEIGMGEDLSLDERDSIRTPMQWANTRNGGFSNGPPERLVIPVIQGGEFGYERVNVATQQRDPASLLNWVERMTRLRLRTPEFGTAACEFLTTDQSSVLAHRCGNDNSAVIAVHNFSSKKVNFEISTHQHLDGLYDLITNREHPAKRGGKQRLSLDGYGYMWLRESRSPESLSSGS
ncbi:MAG: alpha-glucosidase C-terminal domain-containing protein, partial [Acidobacteriaceae bacterium]|nr:alpha-glucosidase C-terminal domain-containing protein [Acidobacteriaceae bacterium]